MSTTIKTLSRSFLAFGAIAMTGLPVLALAATQPVAPSVTAPATTSTMQATPEIAKTPAVQAPKATADSKLDTTSKTTDLKAGDHKVVQKSATGSTTPVSKNATVIPQTTVSPKS